MLIAAAVTAALLAGCAEDAPTATPTPTTGGSTASPAPSSPTPSSAVPASIVPSEPQPTATPEPPLSLALPAERDQRRIRVAVTPEVAPDGGGRIVVVVNNLSDERIRELVLRWPDGLSQTLFLAPFEPSEQRAAEGGPPLLQAWTKWVLGPGERGEPAGAISLGWGPLDPGSSLTIPIVVTRRGPGPVAFDLQLLEGEALLSLADGEPAELRVSAP